MSKYYPEDEGLFTNAEGLSAAEQLLGFAHVFGEDFQPELSESIAEAPIFLREMVTEIQSAGNFVWLRGADENLTGCTERIFVDGSSVEVYIADYPTTLQRLPNSNAEIRIELRASKGINIQRGVIYELGEEDQKVIRTEFKENGLFAFDELSAPPDDPDLAQEVSRQLDREATLLRAGIDPSGDSNIEFFRLTNEYFAGISNNQRHLYANMALDRKMGLNEQPVGVRELVDLRQALYRL